MLSIENELEFVGRDNKTYKFKTLGLEELIKFTRWVQYKPYRDALDGQLPDEVSKLILKECRIGKVKELVLKEGVDEENAKLEDLIEKEYEINFQSSIVRQAMLSIEGLIRLMQISLEIQGLNPKDILTPEIINDYSKDFYKLIGLFSDSDEKEKEKEESKDPTNPNQKKQ